MLEAMRLAFADRAVWMGDEDFVDVPKEGLLDDDYIAMRSALIDPESRQENVEADDPRPFEDRQTLEKRQALQPRSGDAEEGPTHPLQHRGSLGQRGILHHDNRIVLGYRTDGARLWIYAQQRVDRL